MARAAIVTGLQCEEEAQEGARLVLLTRVREMIDFREKAFDWSDPEGVHDMRVASRRLRSALRDFSLLIPKRKVAKLSAEVKIVADALGAVRDEDVAIIALDKLLNSAPQNLTQNLAALIEERTARRELARTNLTATITEKRLANIQRVFIGTLKSDAQSNTKAQGQTSSSPQTTFRDFGRERIKKQFKRFEKRAVALYSPLASEALHELRIEAKRLRYALELFDVCWAGGADAFAAQVADMQGALGELHDCDVWIDDLEHRLLRLHATRNKNADTEANLKLQATIWLLDHFAKERTKNFRHALSLWRKWQSSAFANKLVATLDDDGAPY